MKTSHMLLIGAAGVAAIVFWPKIKEFTGLNTTARRGPPVAQVWPGQGRFDSWPGGGLDAFPGQGNAYGHYKHTLHPRFA